MQANIFFLSKEIQFMDSENPKIYRDPVLVVGAVNMACDMPDASHESKPVTTSVPIILTKDLYLRTFCI